MSDPRPAAVVGAIGGLVASVPFFLAGPGLIYILLVQAVGRAWGFPAPLWDRARMTDFGPNLAPAGAVVVFGIWGLTFAGLGAAAGAGLRTAFPDPPPRKPGRERH